MEEKTIQSTPNSPTDFFNLSDSGHQRPESVLPPKSRQRSLLIPLLLVMILVLLASTIFFGSHYLKTSPTPRQFNLQDSNLVTVPATTLPASNTNFSNDWELVREKQLQEDKNTLLLNRPDLSELVGDSVVQSLSTFTVPTINKSGWVFNLESPENENYLDRYLAFDGKHALLESDILVECGNVTAQAIDQRFFSKDPQADLDKDNFIYLNSNCPASPNKVSLINVNTMSKVPFSDPNNLMNKDWFTDDGDIIGKYLFQDWDGIMAIELQGQPLSHGYAVFELATGKLLSAVEFDAYPQFR